MFWYNLKLSGEGDYRTRHAACPVLLGNKWGQFTHTQTPELKGRQVEEVEGVSAV